MLEEIKITTEDKKTIEKDFVLKDLKKFNIVIGKNGSGKTNLFNAIKEEYKNNNEVLVVYIKANEIQLKEYAKTSADSAEMVKELSEILKSNNKTFTVGEDIIELKKDLETKINHNISELMTDDSIKLNMEDADSVKYEWVVRSILDFKVKEGDLDIKKLEDLPQGHQRLVIASIIKAFADQRKELNDKKKKVIILFEEPEIFLHPILKARLRDTLLKISEEFQVIISTHDPYFISIKENIQIYSLCKDGEGKTKVNDNRRITSIVDEYLHITLYSQLSNEELESIDKHNRPYYRQNRDGKKNSFTKEELSLPKYIRNQIHHQENPRTIGFVFDKKEADASEEKNYYTEKDLENSISKMYNVIINRKKIVKVVKILEK